MKLVRTLYTIHLPNEVFKAFFESGDFSRCVVTRKISKKLREVLGTIRRQSKDLSDFAVLLYFVPLLATSKTRYGKWLLRELRQ
jgi:hypothetical protein